MTNSIDSPDPAAVFEIARSLLDECHKQAKKLSINLSDAYKGIDELIREVMRIGNLFEEWACANVDFAELGEVWSYFMHERFGEACMKCLNPDCLTRFDIRQCLHVAIRLELPLRLDGELVVPLDVKALNPVNDSKFHEYQIRSVICCADGHNIAFFSGLSSDDDSFLNWRETPFYSVYGVGTDGCAEHIADRKTYRDAVTLAQNFAPRIKFPNATTWSKWDNR